MAKGDKQEKEDYEFVPPDFDEDAFIHKEMVSFKTTATLILVGIAAAVVSWIVFQPVGGADAGWYVGLLIVGLAFGLLRPLYRVLKFDIGHYGRREWLGSAFLLFFTWLAFFMILLNPPFSDTAAPTVHLHASPSVAAADETVRLDVFVVDNAGVRQTDIRLVGPDGPVAGTSDFEALGHGHHRLTTALPAGVYRLEADGVDRAGHRSSGNLTLRVVADPVEATVRDLPTRAEEIFVSVAGLDRDAVWAVYADKDHDPATPGDRVYFEYFEARGGWVATSNYAGWSQGNNSFTIFVEERNRFEGQTLVPGGILRDGPHTIEVGQPGEYDKSRPNRINPTQPPARDIPGLGLPLLVAGLVGLAVVARRRR